MRRLFQRSRQRRWGCYGDGREFEICLKNNYTLYYSGYGERERGRLTVHCWSDCVVKVKRQITAAQGLGQSMIPGH